MANYLYTGTGSGGGGGGGDVVGPGSSTDNAVVRWNGTAGTDVQNSGIIASDANDLYVPGILSAGVVTASAGAKLHVEDGSPAGAVVDANSIAIFGNDELSTNMWLNNYTFGSAARYAIAQAGVSKGCFGWNGVSNFLFLSHDTNATTPTTGIFVKNNSGTDFFGVNTNSPTVACHVVGGGLFSIPDDAAGAFTIQQGADNFLAVNTNNGAESILFGNVASNPAFIFQGSGTFAVDGVFTHAGASFGVLGATPAAQQAGGAQTAGAVYTATEQAMLQAAYDALRTFGFLS